MSPATETKKKYITLQESLVIDELETMKNMYRKRHQTKQPLNMIKDDLYYQLNKMHEPV